MQPRDHSKQASEKKNLFDLAQQRRGLFKQGRSLYMQNSYFAAIKYFDWALKLEEHNKEITTDDGVYAYRAFCHTLVGNYKQAVADFSSEIDLCESSLVKTSQAYYFSKVLTYREYQPEQTNIEYTIAINLANRAYAYFRLGQYKKAEKDFHEALTAFKDFHADERFNPQIIKHLVTIYQNRSKLYYKCERYDAALEDSNQARDLAKFVARFNPRFLARYYPKFSAGSFISEVGLFSNKMRTKVHAKQHPEHESAEQFKNKL